MVKPGYKQTEVGVIPEDWEDKKLGEIGGVCMCKRIFADQTSDTGEIPFFKIGTFGKSADAYISRSLYEDFRRRFSYPKKGDVLISAAGTLGRSVVFDGKDAYFQDSNIVWLDVDKEKLCNAYLNHYYKVIQWASSEGSTIARLYNGIICNTHIALPDIEEQEKIAAVLSEMDELMSLTEKQLEKKKAIKQGAMQELLTGKKRLPGFSGGWQYSILGNSAELSTATISTKQIDSRHYVGTDNMVADKGGVRDNEISLTYPSVREYIVGDVLLSNIRPYLKKIWHATRNGGCSNDVLVIRSKNSDELNSSFLYYLLSTDAFFDEIMANAVGTKMPRGDKAVIRSYAICYPKDILEQKAIAEILSNMDAEIETLQQKMEKYRQLKQGMMQQLLTGKIRLV